MKHWRINWLRRRVSVSRTCGDNGGLLLIGVVRRVLTLRL